MNIKTVGVLIKELSKYSNDTLVYSAGPDFGGYDVTYESNIIISKYEDGIILKHSED
jgi:hypothetical protein